MSDELDILKIVAENPEVSQRKISEQMGISLGQVNFLIKKCVKKGLIKIEGQTAKSIKYNLTPKGFTEKAALTLQYIRISYEAILSLTDKVKKITDQYKAGGEQILICGDNDEIMSIIRLALRNITLLDNTVKNAVILYWDEEKMERQKNELHLTHCKYINILE
ncbi:MAG: winged helix-turn-helix transcriptional regulator [Eubacteriales bacterium]|nr:winged helix-turn-helix transcriptional regulator [Eubacteriales bacterium]